MRAPSVTRGSLALAFLVGFVLVFLPGLLLAQDAPPNTVPEALSPLGALAVAILSGVIGWLSSKAYDGLKTLLPMYDRLPAIVHQIAAPVFQFGFGWVSAATGAELLTDVHGVSAGWLGGLLNILLAAGIKRWEKSRQPADATAILESSRAAGSVR